MLENFQLQDYLEICYFRKMYIMYVLYLYPLDNILYKL